MEKSDGTWSGVTQSIDAWSFGCVLSVAATWIVLGFQGLRQYERLRQLSPANNKDGARLDRFHDGYHVIPEVGEWHDYLRGHLRPSDTTTELVLALIESKLLLAEPAARHTMGELCEKLKELSDWAEHKIKNLRKHSRDIDPQVMKALSNIEEEAQIQRTSEPKTGLLQQPLSQVNYRDRASMQINKEEMIRNKPLGQTAHRRRILRERLDDYYRKKPDAEPKLTLKEKVGSNATDESQPLPTSTPFATGNQVASSNLAIDDSHVDSFRLVSEDDRDSGKPSDGKSLSRGMPLISSPLNEGNQNLPRLELPIQGKQAQKAGTLIESVEKNFIPASEESPWQYDGFQYDEEPESPLPSPYVEQSEDDINWDEDSTTSNKSTLGDSEDVHNTCEGGGVNSARFERLSQVTSLFQYFSTIEYAAQAHFLWRRCIRWIRHFVRPRILEGYERLEWTCVSTKYPQCSLTHGNRNVETRCTVTIEMITLSP